MTTGNLNLSRQAEIVPETVRNLKVAIIGCGGIGSNVAHVLASMGVQNFVLYDPDRVGPENIGPQYYRVSDIRLFKTDALRWNLEEQFEGVRLNIETHNDVYINQQHPDVDIVILGLDSLRVREEIWAQHGFITARWWLDGRMGGTITTIFTVDLENPEHRRIYAEGFRLQEAPLPCGMKATSFLTKGIIPGLIGSQVAHILNREEIPFRVIWDSKTDIFITSGG